MFDFLKKKISGFIDGLTKKEEEKAGREEPAQAVQEEEKAAPERMRPEREIKPGKAPPVEEKPAPKPVEKVPPRIPKEAKGERKREEPKQETKPEEKPAKEAVPEPTAQKPGLKEIPAPETPVKARAERAMPAQRPENAKPHPEPPRPAASPAETRAPPIHAVKPETAQPAPEKAPSPPAMPAPKPEVPKPALTQEKPPSPQPSAPARAPAPQEEKPRERLKLGIVGTVKSLITREVQISENDVKGMVESLELELLEADVDMAVAGSIKDELLAKLVGSKVGRDKLHSFVSQSIRETLVDILTNERDFDIVERVQGAEKPVKIMFIGINGAGKTTTIAKVAKLLMDSNRKVVFAAADTFRAAAIEQMAVHAERLNVKMIKREYGSDPTSVAYDAVNYAKAHGIDAVLIDTAGRQDTNISLLNEMKKMRRVISPDIIIYIGESIAGNAILEQISSFNREVGVDAVILSKLDCDPKGGTMLSINKATGVPIIYVGVGQGYDALERFEPEKIVGRIVE